MASLHPFILGGIYGLIILIRTLGVLCSEGTEIDAGLHFTIEPQDTIVKKNEPVIFNCSAWTLPEFEPLKISWTHNDAVINDDRRVVLRNGSLYIKRVSHRKKRGLSDLGRYECIATNLIGAIASRSAKLQIASLSRFTSDFHPVAVETGGVARLVCNITGVPEPTFLWEFDRSPLPLAKTKNKFQKYFQLSSGVLQIYNVSTSDAGLYRCKAFNTANQRSREISVNVSGNNQNIQPQAPRIVAGPLNLTVSAGNSVTLECLVSGYPSLQVSWTRQDGKQRRGRIVGQGNLEITSVSHRDAAAYTCHAKVAGFSREVQSTATLSIISPPVIRQAPTSLNQVTAGTVRLVCQIEEGVPTPTIRWLKNNDVLHINGRIKEMSDSVLVISQLDYSDAGYYQCIATNAAGETKSAARLQVKKVDNAPAPPRNLRASTKSSEAIYLEWEPPDYEGDKPIIAFSVHYYPSEGTSVTEEQEVVQLSHHVMENLRPFTNYTFYVVAYTPAGASDRSRMVVQQTGEALPVGGPQVTLTTMSPTSIKVEWGELPPFIAQGVVTGYKVIYRLHNQPSEMVESVPGTARKYIINNLDPFTSYDIRILAGNKVGFPDLDDGDLPWVTEKTPGQSTPEAPQPPEMQLVPISPTSVMVSWTPGKGKILGYKLYYNIIGSETKIGPIILLNNSVRHQFNNLPASTWCEFSILAFNTFGYSPQVVKSVKTKDPPVNGTDQVDETPVLLPPPSPVKIRGKPLGNSEILLEWEMLQHPFPITNYTIRYYAVTPNEEKDEKLSESSGMRCLFTNLRSYTVYEFSVCAHSQGIPGPFSKKVRVRTQEGTPSPPVGLSSKVLVPGIVRLDWRPPEEANGVIVSYIIMYNMDKDQPELYWLKKIQNGSSTSVRLEDLEIDKPYYFKLRAQTSAGEGPPTPVLEVKMCEGPLCRPPVPILPGGGGSSTVAGNSTSTPTEESGTGDQMMGIIIGVSIGGSCIIICIIIITLWKRCCSAAARGPSSPAHFAGSQQLPANGDAESQPGHSAPYLEFESYTPMLELLPENSALDTKGGTGGGNSSAILERRMNCRDGPTANGLEDSQHLLASSQIWVEQDSIQGHDHETSQLHSSGNITTSGNTSVSGPPHPGHPSANSNHINTGQNQPCTCERAVLQSEEDNSNQSGLPGNHVLSPGNHVPLPGSHVPLPANHQPLPGHHSRSNSPLHQDDATVCNLSKSCPVTTATTSCLDDVNGNPKDGSTSSNMNRMQAISGQSHDRLQNARPKQSRRRDAKQTQERNSVGGTLPNSNSNSTQGVSKSLSYDASGYAQVGPLGGSMVRQPDGNVHC
ncbi:protogenin-like [Lineus longissimus]|uniref:protogenin-like n=1 Tax=Lineus longissimus TaxID=88925 RepID=UPI002B4D0168